MTAPPRNQRTGLFRLFLVFSCLLHIAVGITIFRLAEFAHKTPAPTPVIMVDIRSTAAQKGVNTADVSSGQAFPPAKSVSAAVTPPSAGQPKYATPTLPQTPPAPAGRVSTQPAVPPAPAVSGNVSRTASATGQQAGTATKAAQESPSPLQQGNNEASHPREVRFGGVHGPSFSKQVQPTYPGSARRRGKEGTVLLRLSISETGHLSHIELLEDPGHGFADAAIEAVRNSSFSPARHNGRPVAVKATLPVRFALH